MILFPSLFFLLKKLPISHIGKLVEYPYKRQVSKAKSTCWASIFLPGNQWKELQHVMPSKTTAKRPLCCFATTFSHHTQQSSKDFNTRRAQSNFSFTWSKWSCWSWHNNPFFLLPERGVTICNKSQVICSHVHQIWNPRVVCTGKHWRPLSSSVIMLLEASGRNREKPFSHLSISWTDMFILL